MTQRDLCKDYRMSLSERDSAYLTANFLLIIMTVGFLSMVVLSETDKCCKGVIERIDQLEAKLGQSSGQ